MGWYANQKARNEAKKSGVPLPDGHPARKAQDKSDAFFDRKRAEVADWEKRKHAEHEARAAAKAAEVDEPPEATGA